MHTPSYIPKNYFFFMKGIVECLDIGGTRTRYALFENDQMVLQKTIPTIVSSFTELVQHLSTVIQSNRKESMANIETTVIGLPGPIRNEQLLNAPPMGIRSSHSLNQIKEIVSNTVLIENDLNLGVLAEKEKGTGKEMNEFGVLTISTGIGCGIVWNGKVIGNGSGEFGHSVIEKGEKALECACGRKGCWASISSGQGIQKQLNELGEKISPQELFEKKEKNEKEKKLVEKIRDANAHGIGNIINAYALEALVVMGGIGNNYFETVIPKKEEIIPYTINTIPPIYQTKLGDTIGLWGAYYLGKKKQEKEE